MLSEQKCAPCKAGTPPMKKDIAEQKLADLPDWAIVMDGRAIRKRYTFANFLDALAFANKIGDVAEEQGHHPDLMLGWGYVEVVLLTHNIAGLHDNDFIIAAKIDTLVGQK